VLDCEKHLSLFCSVPQRDFVTKSLRSPEYPVMEPSLFSRVGATFESNLMLILKTSLLCVSEHSAVRF
jgi:hypothetical protein